MSATSEVWALKQNPDTSSDKSPIGAFAGGRISNKYTLVGVQMQDQYLKYVFEDAQLLSLIFVCIFDTNPDALMVRD